MSDHPPTGWNDVLLELVSQITSDLARDAMAELASFHGEAKAQDARAWAESVAASTLRSLGDAAGNEAAVAPFVDLFSRGASAEEVLRGVGLARRHFLRASLRALPGLADATEGIERLSACFDAVSVAVGRHRDASMEAQRVEGAARFRNLLAALGNIVIVLDGEGRIYEWNPCAEAMYGYSRDEVIGENYFAMFLPPDVQASVREDTRKVLSGTPTRDGENTVLSRDGTSRVVRWNVDRLLDGGGRPIAVVASGTDVTEHRMAQKHLERREAEVQAILDNAPITVFVKDLEGRFTFTNRDFDAIFDHSRGWAVGKKDADFLPAEVVAQNRDNDRAALEAGHALESEELIPGKDGMHVYMVSKFPLLDASGAPYAVCGIALDITARKRAEEERAALADRIIEAQHEALRALSSPLLPIANGVVVMPLVGAIDAVRAALVQETLLAGVGQHQAEIAILDITGIDEIDAAVASGLVGAAQGAALLGAEVLLTGVRPAAARTLIELGVDMRGIKTLSSLQQGVTHAISRSRRRSR